MGAKKILALAGPKGVGKTTTARILKHSSPIFSAAAIKSFAGPLKDMLQTILPPEAFTAEGKEDAVYGLCGRTPRYLMQTLGTEWGRKIVGEQVWLETMRRQIASSPAKVIIIDDLRFDNEAAFVQDLGGVVMEVTRPGFNYTNLHSSERGVSKEFLDGFIDGENTNYVTFNPF